jgi:type VI secretion system protein ImpC
MPNEFTPHSIHLDIDPNAQSSRTNVADDEPFRILIIGDFGGRSSRGLRTRISNRRPKLIDRDNFDETLAALVPALQLGTIELTFSELDDFHPDRIFSRLQAFQKLQERRSMPPTLRPEAPPAAAIPPNLLESILEQSPTGAEVKAEDAGDLAAFLKKVTAPYLQPRPGKHQEQWSARIDASFAELMRGILHQPFFQALEAAWRGVAMLVDRLDTDGALQLYVFDATLEELAEDDSELRSLVAESGKSWSVIVGDFEFGQSEHDAAVLRRIAQAARLARAPFLAGAAPPAGEAEAGWLEFRRSPEASWVGLAVPRFLMRLPYGAATSPIEAFPFEEMPEHQHSRYLWGNSAFCCAYLLALTFLSEGWEMRPGVHRRIDGLPLHTYEKDGDTLAQPCAEVFLSESDADFLLDNGFMPLASIRNSDSALLVRFQSVALPLSTLSGRWR